MQARTSSFDERYGPVPQRAAYRHTDRRVTMQLSLRHLFLAVSALALLCALGGWATKDYRREQAIHYDLVSLGAKHVDVDIHRGRTEITLTLTPATNVPALAKYRHAAWRQIGIEGRVSPELLTPLARLKSVHCLHFHNCWIADPSDLDALGKLRGLELVFFSNSTIAEEALNALESLPNLKGAVFHLNQIAPGAVDRLAAALPHIQWHAIDGRTGATTFDP